MWGENARRIGAIETLLHGNGQPGLLARVAELQRTIDGLTAHNLSQDKQHQENRRLLLSILATVLANLAWNHWPQLVRALG
jgi:hypothetical protein